MNEINDGSALLGKKQNRVPVIILYFVIFIQIIIIMLMCFFYVTVTDGESMEETLQDGQLFIVRRIGYKIERGDIVTINTADAGEKEHILIKRVIGMGGDKLIYMKSENGRHIELYRLKNGADRYEKLEEPYIKSDMSLSASYGDRTSVLSYIPDFTEIDFSENTKRTEQIENAAITVPADNIYFLGDNRNESMDSRFYGVRSIKNVQGKMIKKISKNGSTEKFFKFIFSFDN